MLLLFLSFFFPIFFSRAFFLSFFFFWVCLRKRKTSPQILTFLEKKMELLPDEKSHGLGTQRESCKEGVKKNVVFPTILG